MKSQIILLALFAGAWCHDAAPEVVHLPHRPPVHPAHHPKGEQKRCWHYGTKEAEGQHQQHDVELRQKFLAQRKARFEQLQKKKQEELKEQRRLNGLVFPSFGSFGLSKAWSINDKSMGEAQTMSQGAGKSALKLDTNASNASAVGKNGAMASGNFMNQHNSWNKDLFVKAPTAVPVAVAPAVVPAVVQQGAVEQKASPFDAFKNFGAAFANPKAFGGWTIPGVTAGASAGEASPFGMKNSWMKTANTMADAQSMAMGDGAAQISASKAGVEAEAIGTEGTANKGTFGSTLDAWSDDATSQITPVEDPKPEVLPVVGATPFP